MGYQEEKQRQLDLRYLRMAAIWAENSYCVRRKVGALIVKDRMIISDGYNGTPAGFENVCEDEQGLTKSYVLHALHHGRPVHRMLETHYPGGHQTGGLRGRLPFGGGAGPAAPRRHRVRAVPDRPGVTRNGRPEEQGKGRRRSLPFSFRTCHPARKRPGSERQRTTGNGKKHRPRGGEGENAYKAKVMRNAGPGRHIP